MSGTAVVLRLSGGGGIECGVDGGAIKSGCVWLKIVN